MGTGAVCVQRLADLVGLVVTSSDEYDWAAVEASLGVPSLPEDYKAFVETFPRGSSHGLVNVIRPGDGSDPFRLDAVRARWSDRKISYPIFPEPSGLLPWGEGTNGQTYFWLTHASDPNLWPVVCVDAEMRTWETFPGTMCEFLIEMVSGPVDPPVGFRPHGSDAAIPTNELDELTEVLGPPNPKGEAADIGALEKDMGLSLPSDFKGFIDRYGVGVFCDIRIVGPDTCAEFDMRALMQREIELMTSSAAARAAFGDPRGGLFVPWGETPSGWIFGWSATGPDPERWGTTSVAPDLTLRSWHNELSFSTYLLHYCGHRNQRLVSFEEDRWRGAPIFTPHRHG